MIIKSTTSIKGKRDYMEDSASIIANSPSVVTVCDGHAGDSLSKRTTRELPLILHNIAYGSIPLDNAMTIKQIIMNYGDDVSKTRAGTTLTGVVHHNNYIYIFNVGDSRTSVHLKSVNSVVNLLDYDNKITSYKTIFFTTIDHDSTLVSEQERIKKAGGVLIGDRLNGSLNVTRTLGDNGVGPGLDYTPDIYWIAVSEISGPILLYTDGVYQNMTNHRDLEQKHLIYHIAEKNGTDGLVRYAFANNRSEDNITAVLVEL